MDEEGILVRGTDNPSVAARWILEHPTEAPPDLEEFIRLCERSQDPSPLQEDAKEYVARWVESFTQYPERTGYFRFNVQEAESDYTWMLGYADAPGRGNFLGVLWYG